MSRAAPLPEPPPDEAAILALGLAFLAARAAGQDGHAEHAAWRAARLRHEASAIDQLSQAFALSPFEEELLFLVAAADLDGALLPVGSRPSLHFAARLLFGADRLPAEAWGQLAPEAPLRCNRLLLLEGPLALATPLAVPQSLLLHLAGVPPAPAALPVLPLPPRLHALAETLPPRLLLIGPEGAGKRALAAAILARHGHAAHACPASAEPEDALRDARLAGAAPVLALAEGRAPARLPDGPVILLAAAPPAGPVPLPRHRLPLLSPSERSFCWQKLRPGLGPREAGRLGHALTLGPSAVAELGDGDPAQALGPSLARLEALATHVPARRSLADMVLAPDTRAALDWLVAAIRGTPSLLAAWGEAAPPAVSGLSVLFAGPSGTGKTMAAEAIAQALGADLFVVDLARVVSKYIGETEKNLGAVFDAAGLGGAVLLFDEADALFGRRSEVKDAHDRYANQEVAYLLHRMERHPGPAILATNLRSHIDPAFLRRLRFVIDFPLPDAAARARLWQRALPPGHRPEAIDFERLARLELSGGNIMTIAANAAARALAEDMPLACALDTALLLAAARLEFHKLDRDPAVLAERSA
ncbi:MAG: ATP-binding protein [Sphingomonadaceae bacterium]